jgi:hypothetical protein
VELVAAMSLEPVAVRLSMMASVENDSPTEVQDELAVAVVAEAPNVMTVIAEAELCTSSCDRTTSNSTLQEFS